MGLFTTAIHWLFPQQCSICHCASPTSTLCQNCRKTLPWNSQPCQRCALPITAGQSQCGACLSKPPAFIRSIIPFLYQPPISTYIIQLKFQQQLHQAHLLGELLTEAICRQSLPLPQVIIPVPLHTSRLRQRGFNQAIEIAKPLSKALNLPLLYTDCIRHKNTLPQSQLSASARRRNLAGAFSLQKPLEFQHVALLDDVMTTGQTIRVLSQMLQKNIPAINIEVWCCARTEE